MWKFIKNTIVIVLSIGLPVFIYLAFFADEALMEPDYDVQMGARVAESIAADPEEYPLLPVEENEDLYRYMRDMVTELTSGPDIQYANIFAYDKVKIINRDDVLNAFCTPGGYIYVYTGLIHYLDAKDHLAGVLGHEIAHAELRHSAIDMQREYGRDKLMEYLIFATPASLGTLIQAQMLEELTSLSYSRDQEAEADDWSVKYLEDTQYACNGTAGFFQKLLDRGQDAAIPEFLSDHPIATNRVYDVNALARKMQCDINLADQGDWSAFKQALKVAQEKYPPPEPKPEPE